MRLPWGSKKMASRNRYSYANGRQEGSYAIGSLEERVHGVERNQTALAERINAVSEALEGRFDRLTINIDARLDKISEALENRSKGILPALSFTWSIVIVVVGGFYLLVNSQIQNNSEMIGAVSQSQVRVAEILRTETMPRIEADKLRADDMAMVREMDADIDQIRMGYVARPEYAVQINGLTERIGRIEALFGSTYSIGDVLKDIQDRLQRLEERTGSIGGRSIGER
jgi:hypothetical protein